MALSEDLVSQFVDATKDNEEKSKETITYGTIKERDGKTYVLLDGATEEHLTPVYTTANVQVDERVTVMIKNHTATVTGNMSSPAARTGDVEDLSNIVAEKVDTEVLVAERAEIEELIAQKATIENLTATNAEIENLKAKNAEIENLKANKAEIEELYATKAEIGNLYAKKATVEELYATKAAVGELVADKASIKDLEATNANVTNLDADVAKIDTLIFGSASGNTIQTEFSNSVIAQLGDAQIKDAMIENVSAGKITAGSINTNLVNVTSEDGSLIIKDETIQIKDGSRVRVQIGKDASGDYSINIWDVNGNLMFSEGGITDSAIKKAIIRNDMVADNANISAGKLDIDSLFEEINGSEKTLKSSKIYFDDEEQTLDVAFKTLATDTDELKETVSSQGTELEVIQGQISSKVWEQDITEAVDGIKIGGRNLLVDSEKEIVLTDSDYTNINIRDCLNDHIGKTMTISFDFRINSGGTVKNFYFYAYKENDGNITSSVRWLFTPTTDWGRYSFTTTVLDTGLSTNKIYFWTAEGLTNFSIRKIKIELGNKATDWTPAPEDVNSAIDAAKSEMTTKYSTLEQTVNGISATVGEHTTAISEKADSSELTETNDKVAALELDVNGFKTTVSDTYATKTSLDDYATTEELNTAKSEFEQTARDISLEVSETTVTSALGDYYTKTDVDSKIQVSAEGITSLVSAKASKEEVEAAVEGMERRNLLPDSEKERTPPTGNNGFNINVKDALSQHIGKTITISFDVRTNTGGTPGKLQVHSLSVNGITFQSKSYLFDHSTSWKRYSFTTTVVDNGVLDESYKSDIIWFLEGTYDDNGARYTENFSIRRVKIELGSTATDWSPANTDYSTLGINLLVDSEKERTPEGTGVNALWVNVKDALQSHIGKTITISFDARTNPGGTPGRMTVHSESVNGITFSKNWYNYTLTTSWQRFSFTTTVVDNGILAESNRSDIIYFIDNNSPRVPNNFSIRKIKIELGTAATEWISSSIDPVNNRIISAETRIEQTETAITSHANLLSEQDGKIQEQSSKLTQTATEIRAEFADSSKTATNYIQGSADGLMVADNTKSTLGNNVFIDSDSVDIRNGTTTMSSFAANSIELGKNSRDAVIKFCGGDVTLQTTKDNNGYYDGVRFDSEASFRAYGKRGAYLGAGVMDDSPEYSMLTIYRDETLSSTHALLRSARYLEGSQNTMVDIGTYADDDEGYIDLSVNHYINGAGWKTQQLIMQQASTRLNDGDSGNSGLIRPWNKVLHDSSAFQMNENQTITLKEAISAQPTGAILVFREINDGSLQNSGIHTYFVPKLLIQEAPGYGHSISWAHYNGSHYVCKYLYINDTTIKGNSYNDDSGSTMSPSGITVTNNTVVLWRVYGV